MDTRGTPEGTPQNNPDPPKTLQGSVYRSQTSAEFASAKSVKPDGTFRSVQELTVGALQEQSAGTGMI